MGAPSKLTPERLDLLERAVGLGLTEKEAAQAVGVGDSTLLEWRRKAAAYLDYFAEPRKRHLRKDLVELARVLRLSIAPGRKKLTNAKLAAYLETEGAKFAEFAERMEGAAPKAEATLLGQVEISARGGKVITDIDPDTGNLIRRGVRKKKTVTEMELRPVINSDGELEGENWVATKVTETVEELEMPPDRIASLKLLEFRWPDKYGKQKPDVDDPAETARAIAAASEAMFQSIPGPPAADGDEDELDALLDEIDAMSDEEVDAALADLGRS